MFKQSYKSSAGVTLLEMMVALLVLSIGLLGVATLQAKGQQFNQVAYLRTQATFLAYDLMERIRINSNRTGIYTRDEDALNADNCPENKDCDGAAANCPSESDLASYDLFQWCTYFSSTLPKGDATNTRIVWDGGNKVYTITINWKNVVPDRPIETRKWTLQL
jgi:type IV pilus assembly protein PilV